MHLQWDSVEPSMYVGVIEGGHRALGDLIVQARGRALFSCKKEEVVAGRKAAAKDALEGMAVTQLRMAAISDVQRRAESDRARVLRRLAIGELQGAIENWAIPW